MAEPTNAELIKTIEGMKADLAKADALRKATAAEKQHMVGMTSDQADAFMAKSPADRQSCMAKSAEEAKTKADALAKAKASDETLTVDGVTIAKSDNPGMFAILKSQQAELAKNAEEIRKANERTEMVTLEKRATDEFGNLPGTPAEKAALLKHLKSAPEEVVKTAESILKAATAKFDPAFGRVGTSKSGDPATAAAAGNARTVWKGKLEELRKANPGLTGEQILDKAHQLHSAEFAAAYPVTVDALRKSTEAATGVVAA